MARARKADALLQALQKRHEKTGAKASAWGSKSAPQPSQLGICSTAQLDGDDDAEMDAEEEEEEEEEGPGAAGPEQGTPRPAAPMKGKSKEALAQQAAAAAAKAQARLTAKREQIARQTLEVAELARKAEEAEQKARERQLDAANLQQKTEAGALGTQAIAPFFGQPHCAVCSSRDTPSDLRGWRFAAAGCVWGAHNRVCCRAAALLASSSGDAAANGARCPVHSDDTY